MQNAHCCINHQGNEPFSVWCMIFKRSNLRWQDSVRGTNAFYLSIYVYCRTLWKIWTIWKPEWNESFLYFFTYFKARNWQVNILLLLLWRRVVSGEISIHAHGGEMLSKKSLLVLLLWCLFRAGFY